MAVPVDATPDVRTVPLARLAPSEWRSHAGRQMPLPGLGPSLDRYGHARLPVWNERTGTLVDGHRLVSAMIEAGHTEAQVIVVDLPAPEAKALEIELHLSPRRWDPDALLRLIRDIRAGAPEAYDELRLVDIEIEARLELMRLSGAAPGQQVLFR